MARTTQENAQHWDTRYSQETRSSFEEPRPFLVENAHRLPPRGLALDAAMGLGGNAGFLLQRGLRVLGVDLSSLGVRIAKARQPALMAVIADLRQFHIPANAFDVITNFFFLERCLFPVYEQALRPGGLLIFETMTVEMHTLRPDIDPLYLLEPGELSLAFPNLETLVYREGWQRIPGRNPRCVASLVARRT